MPGLSAHQSNDRAKVLLIGESGSGKTGAFASLAAEGFKLRIIDMDDGLDILKNYLTNPNSEYVKKNPKCAENVQFVTCKDEMTNLNGKPVPKGAKAWPAAIEKLVHWREGVQGTPEYVDLGPVSTWGPDTFLIIDSMSMLSTAALNYHLAMNALIGAKRTSNEIRRDVGAAQRLLISFLEMIFDSSIKCNVILTSHITFVTEMGGAPNAAEGQVQPGQGFPAAIGRALSPQIPKYFNNVLIARTTGVGSMIQHKIYTSSQLASGQVINAKSAAPMNVKPDYGIVWGMAEFYRDIKGAPNVK